MYFDPSGSTGVWFSDEPIGARIAVIIPTKFTLIAALNQLRANSNDIPFPFQFLEEGDTDYSLNLPQ